MDRIEPDVPWMHSVLQTKFCVDYFRRKNVDCKGFFLTHWHMDHYEGLTPQFNGIIYCSEVTADLLIRVAGIGKDHVRSLPLHTPTKIDGITVTLFDANHCAGAVMFFFEGKNGFTQLHTGDFRYSPSVFSTETPFNTVLNTGVDLLFLDTTFNTPRSEFPTQNEALGMIVDVVKKHLNERGALVLLGTYKVGKERVLLHVAKETGKKIYCSPEKHKMLSCLKLGTEFSNHFTVDSSETNIHAVNMQYRSAPSIKQNYPNSKMIYVVHPTGFLYPKNKLYETKTGADDVKKYGVGYSEHCNFAELKVLVFVREMYHHFKNLLLLKDFVALVKPRVIVPTVDADSRSQVTRHLVHFPGCPNAPRACTERCFPEGFLKKYGRTTKKTESLVTGRTRSQDVNLGPVNLPRNDPEAQKHPFEHRKKRRTRS